MPPKSRFQEELMAMNKPKPPQESSSEEEEEEDEEDEEEQVEEPAPINWTHEEQSIGTCF